MLSDEQLLRSHIQGDTDAFGVLFERHQSHLWAVALRTMCNPDDAADALQDALVSAHQTASKFRFDSKVSSWLHRIVVNSCLDRLRRNKIRLSVPLPDHDVLPIADPSDQMTQVDLSLSINKALAQLPATQRAVVIAVDVEGYSVSDAAHLLGVPPGTIKSRASRARARLAEILGHIRDD